jgi:hypothetical protein
MSHGSRSGKSWSRLQISHNLLKSFGASSIYHALGSDGKLGRDEMKAKFMRWLPPEERAIVQQADRIFHIIRAE